MTSIEWNLPGYTEMRELGAGGGGRVVLATYDDTGAQVAIKYLAERSRTTRFPRPLPRRGAGSWWSWRDPNVVQLYEYSRTCSGPPPS